MLNPFKQVTQGFIMTFGITPPSPKQELTATVFICGLLFGTVALVLGLGMFALEKIF